MYQFCFVFGTFYFDICGILILGSYFVSFNTYVKEHTYAPKS